MILLSFGIFLAGTGAGAAMAALLLRLTDWREPTEHGNRPL